MGFMSLVCAVQIHSEYKCAEGHDFPQLSPDLTLLVPLVRTRHARPNPKIVC